MRIASAWLLYLVVAVALLVSSAAAKAAAISAPRSTSVAFQEGSETTMSATALDFREMMRKERELAMKKRTVASAATTPRYLSKHRKPLDLKRNHRVEGQGVDGIYYVPGFVTSSEGRLLEKAAQSGGGGDGGDGPDWKELYKRRLQIHGGTPHPSGMVEEELPLFLREVCDALVEAGVFPASSPPNHVLLNEYSSGQGIGPHKDGPLYEGRVAILSLGREACLDFWGSLEDAKADCAAIAASAAGADNNGAPGTGSPGCQLQVAAEAAAAAARRALASVRCEDCSLVVFEGAAYYDAWHGIASTAGTEDGAPETTAAGAAAVAKVPEAAVPPRSREAAAAEGVAGGEEVGREDGEGAAAGKGAQGAATEKGAVGGDVRGCGAATGGGEGGAKKRLSFTIRRVARVVPADSVMEHAEARSEMERRRRGFERSVTETGVTGRGPTPAAAAAAAAVPPKD